MAQKKHVLVDSDVWVGFLVENDTNFKKAEKLFEKMQAQSMQIVLSSAILAETVTVLSHKVGQEAAKTFLGLIKEQKSEYVTIFLDETLNNHALELFVKQHKKGTSFVDCSNVVLVEEYQLDYICAFDKCYHRQFGMKNLAYLD